MNIKLIGFILTAFLTLPATGGVQGQTDPQATTAPSDTTRRSILDPDVLRLRALEEMSPSSIKAPSAAGAESTLAADSISLRRYREALQGYYGYMIQGYAHRLRVFKWQLLSSRIIFFVVILLVAAGVFFSGVQFYAGVKEKREKGAEAPAVTEFEASMKGIKVSSSTLGVIILVISLAFFYLYLAFVYPIEEIF